MTRPRYEPDDPREWLIRAKSSLAHARQSGTEVLFEDLGYAAQQAAEKAIKAVFVKLKQPFPFTHNLDRLLGILRQMKIPIPDEVSRAGTLTPYALDVRYPGLSNETTEGDYREAVAIAEAVVGWAAGVVGSPEKE